MARRALALDALGGTLTALLRLTPGHRRIGPNAYAYPYRRALQTAEHQRRISRRLTPPPI
jgi:hypothetical protein